MWAPVTAKITNRSHTHEASSVILFYAIKLLCCDPIWASVQLNLEMHKLTPTEQLLTSGGWKLADECSPLSSFGCTILRFVLQDSSEFSSRIEP